MTVPIVPGVLCFKSKASFFTMARLCDIRVPDEWRAAIEDAKDALAGESSSIGDA